MPWIQTYDWNGARMLLNTDRLRNPKDSTYLRGGVVLHDAAGRPAVHISESLRSLRIRETEGRIREAQLTERWKRWERNPAPARSRGRATSGPE